MSALTAASALAAGAPTAETKPATNITEKAATLNGVVNPNGAETKYYFEYGTTSKYGSTTAESTLASGTNNVEVKKLILALSVHTAYFFRIVATNSHGTAFGENEVFTTNDFPA